MARDGQNDLVYSVSETAELLKISERSVWNLLRRRELVRVKIAARTLVPASSIESFLSRHIRKWEIGAGSGQKPSEKSAAANPFYAS